MCVNRFVCVNRLWMNHFHPNRVVLGQNAFSAVLPALQAFHHTYSTMPDDAICCDGNALRKSTMQMFAEVQTTETSIASCDIDD